MDQLRAVGKAIKNSPRAIRKKFGHTDHEQLQEDWYHSEDPVNAGVTFYVKYLGSTSVTKTHGTGSTDDAVRTIVQDAKKRGGKLQKVVVTVSSKYIRLVDLQLQMKLDEIPLYRVSYCTVDPYYDKVFCYISRNAETKGLECHAFLCSKKSKAEAITLTVAQAFNIAFEKWQAAKRQKAAQLKAQREAEKVSANGTAGGPHVTSSPVKTNSPSKQPPPGTVATPHINPPPSPGRQALPIVNTQQEDDDEPLQDIGVALSGPSVSRPPLQRRESRDDSHLGKSYLEVKSTIAKAVSLDYLQLDDQFDVEFTRLAEARSNPRLPIGDHIEQMDMKDDVVGFLQGDKTPQDLSQTRSVDDLLQL